MKHFASSPSQGQPDNGQPDGMLYERNRIVVCRNLPHLIYRISEARKHTTKFLLATYLIQFNATYEGCKETSTRLIMAIDPDFLALALRSSLAVAKTALHLATSFLCDKETAAHLTPLVPHVLNLLVSIDTETCLGDDPLTLEMLKRSGDTLNCLKAHMSWGCLLFVESMIGFLGREAIYNVDLDPVEASESVDDLCREMFEFLPHEDGPASSYGATDNTSEPSQQDRTECRLCKLVASKDFKEERIQLEQLNRDLDTLAKAHLEEVRMKAKERDPRENNQLHIGSLILKAARVILSSFYKKEKGATASYIQYRLNALRIALRIVPAANLSCLVDECLKSGNSEVLGSLFSMCNAEDSNYKDAGIQIKVSQYAMKAFVQKLHQENTELFSDFMTTMLQRHNLQALGYDASKNNADELIRNITNVMRRLEIEIHMSLDEFFRQKTTAGVIPTFMLMETLLNCISLHSEILPSCASLFSNIHRIMNTIFDFFEELQDEHLDPGNELIYCCTRVVGCFMSLEPVHLKSTYLAKLPKILSVSKAGAAKWLLPSLVHLEAVDLEEIPNLLCSLLGLLYDSLLDNEIPSQLPDDKNFITDETDSDTFSSDITSRTCKIIAHLFLNMMGNGVALFKAIKPRPFVGALKVKGFNFERMIQRKAHLSPSLPLGITSPMPLDISQDTVPRANVHYALGTLQSVFLNLLLPEGKKLNVVTRTEPVDLQELHEVVATFSSSPSKLKDCWSLPLCEATLAASALCLCRLHQSTVRDLLEPSMCFLMMKCLVISFIYLYPEGITTSSDLEYPGFELWCQIALATTYLLQRQPDFIDICATVTTKLKFKPRKLEQSLLDEAIEYGLTSTECSIAADFMCTLINRL